MGQRKIIKNALLDWRRALLESTSEGLTLLYDTLSWTLDIQDVVGLMIGLVYCLVG